MTQVTVHDVTKWIEYMNMRHGRGGKHVEEFLRHINQDVIVHRCQVFEWIYGNKIFAQLQIWHPDCNRCLIGSKPLTNNSEPKTTDLMTEIKQFILQKQTTQ